MSQKSIYSFRVKEFANYRADDTVPFYVNIMCCRRQQSRAPIQESKMLEGARRSTGININIIVVAFNLREFCLCITKFSL